MPTKMYSHEKMLFSMCIIMIYVGIEPHMYESLAFLYRKTTHTLGNTVQTTLTDTHC